jgi:hypothetical protein
VRRAAQIAIAIALAACGHGSSSSSTHPPASDKCKELTAQFKATLAQGTTECSDVSDCAPVPTGIVGCCEATDSATAATLGQIADQLATSGCEATIMCPAVECEATCDSGRCK